jgi:glycosyltransferase involved in cell wall biosynthesis
VIRFSIITVTYNSASTIEETLRSVRSQAGVQVEHIVVDGGSTDGTLDILQNYRAGIAKLITGPDRGIYDAINKGIAAATGDVIGILHSDDIFASEDILADYARIFETAGCGAVYADLVYVKRDNPARITRRWTSGPYRAGAFFHGWMPPHPTFFAKADLYRTIGVYSLRLRTAADYELMLRFIHKHRISLCYLPRVAVKMRTGGASNESLAARFNANREDREAWRMNGLRPRFYTLLLKPLRKIFQFIG